MHDNLLLFLLTPLPPFDGLNPLIFLQRLLLVLLHHLLEVLHPGDVNSDLHIPIPLLEFDDVVGPQMETFVLRVLLLHDHFHYPAEVVLVLRPPDPETTQREFS